MTTFITGLIITISISFLCWLLCQITYPDEYETPEDFLNKESIFFVSAWVALAIFALPISMILSKILKHE